MRWYNKRLCPTYISFTTAVRMLRSVWQTRKRRRALRPRILLRWTARNSFPPRTWETQIQMNHTKLFPNKKLWNPNERKKTSSPPCHWSLRPWRRRPPGEDLSLGRQRPACFFSPIEIWIQRWLGGNWAYNHNVSVLSGLDKFQEALCHILRPAEH